jgi:hypothetical protein
MVRQLLEADFIAGLMVAIRGCSVLRCVIVLLLPLSPSLSFSQVFLFTAR